MIFQKADSDVCPHLINCAALACREEVAYSRAPMRPPVRPRTFLVANIVDPTQRLFVSKSILDDALPPVHDPPSTLWQ